MSLVAKKCLYQLDCPWDIGAAQIQSHFNVYTPNLPFFYQSDNRQSENKNEYLTKIPLKNKNLYF